MQSGVLIGSLGTENLWGQEEPVDGSWLSLSKQIRIWSKAADTEK